jgi:hypothetical protein
MVGYSFTIGGVSYAVPGDLNRVMTEAQSLADEIQSPVSVSSFQDPLATMNPRASS